MDAGVVVFRNCCAFVAFLVRAPGNDSGGSEQGGPDGFGHLDEDEPVFRVEVVFAALVNDPQVAILLRFGIRDLRLTQLT